MFCQFLNIINILRYITLSVKYSFQNNTEAFIERRLYLLILFIIVQEMAGFDCNLPITKTSIAFITYIKPIS
jgi:hypothetical protein